MTRRPPPAPDPRQASLFGADEAGTVTPTGPARPVVPVLRRPADRSTPPDDPLATALAARLAAWARAAAAPADAVEALHHAALALAHAGGEGHVCIARPASRTLLLASTLVGTEAAPGACPLVLDDGDRLYLHRDFDHEQALARRLRLAAQLAGGSEPSPAARARLRTLAPGQAVAVALALRQRLAILSGGPGTGKTTTVVHLLACLLEDQPTLRIALAAPTGKAAARMTEALRQRGAELPARLRERLPTASSTVHRLLGLAAGTGRFRHGAHHRLPIDMLIVDEASMLDLALARRLLDAVPDTARIVLLGDKDQLAAVESGAVFADVSAHPSLGPAARADLSDWLGFDPLATDGVVVRRPAAGPGDADPAPPPAAAAGDATGPLPDAVVWLTRAYRFDDRSGIGATAAAIRDGDAIAATAALAGMDAWVDDDAVAACAFEGYRPLVEALRHDPTDATSALAALQRFRVLCAVHEGPWGVRRFNERLARQVRAAVPQPATGEGLVGGGRRWFAGEALIVLRNDPTLRLFNGDVALVLPDAAGTLAAVFPQPDGSLRRVPPARLPAHDDAFAMTVHKSQGSEFDGVLVCLPDAGGRGLTRELVYTAVTRARERVWLRAPRAVFAQAVASPTVRSSGLQARLVAARRPAGDARPAAAPAART